MSLQVEIIRASEFVRVGPAGHFDLPASKAALATVAAACRKRGIQHAVMDLRALQPGPKPVFSPADLLELVNTFPAIGFTRRLRLAILYRSDPHKRTRLFAFLGMLHGWNVRAFGDFEEAVQWLSKGDEDEAESPGAEESVPVKIHRARRGMRRRTAAVQVRTKVKSVRRSHRKPAARAQQGTALKRPGIES